MAFLGQEAEEHYHSLDHVANPSTEEGENVVEYMKIKYDEGKISEEICPKCSRKPDSSVGRALHRYR